ncbi:MAG: T9SS type A sorting domain-containing protein [Flavobacteriaceae bacterium]|nr:T9SS type A sorting domain-containing protein [Flavobacteriaceae bacterium]
MRKIYFWLLLVFITWGVTGQTTLINPATDGGFENGSTFTANGWTAVNGANNTLTVGALPVSYAGSSCAYSWSGTAWAGTANATVNHIYKDVIFPAGETSITLSFYYKLSATDLTYDFLKVFLVPTSTTPVAGTQLTSGQLGLTAGYDSATAWTQITITIPESAAGTTQRLVFSWKTDSVSPHVAVALDNIDITSRIPIAPDAAPISFTTTDVTQLGMTVGWTDNSTNETAFKVYRSTDNVNFTQVGANIASTTIATTGTTYSQVQTGLLPGNTYYYRIVALADLESSYLTGSQATNPAGNMFSVASGNWSDPLTWSTNAVPTATDNVLISDGHTVTIDVVAPTCLNLTIGQGVSGILTFTSVAASTLTVNGSITVAAGGNFNAGSIATIVHAVKLGGDTATSPYASNLTVNGVFDMWETSTTGRATLSFFGNQNSLISGNGLIDFNNTNIINKGNIVATSTATPTILEIQSPYTVQGVNTTGFVATLTAGTLKIGGTFTQVNPVFTAVGYSIPATAGIWLNNANFTISGLAGSPTVTGLFKVSLGNYNIGTSSGNSMGSGTGGVFIIEGGVVTVAGRFNLTSAGVYYKQTGGIIYVANITNASASNASFGITSATGTNFIMSGGTIVLVQRNSGTLGSTSKDYYVVATPNITGGTLQVGTGLTATNFNFRLYGYAPNVVIDNTTNNKNVEVYQTSGILIIYGNLTVNSGTTFDCLGMTANVTGNIFNEGVIQGLTTGSRFDFIGTTPQNYTGAGTFGTASAPFIGIGVGISNLTTVTLMSPIYTTRVNLFQGTFVNSNQFNLGIGGTSSVYIQRGGGLAVAGSFDVAPIFNIGSAGITVNYFTSTTNTVSGYEIPTPRSITNLLVNNTGNGMTLSGGNLEVTGTLTMTAGKIFTSSTNLLSLGNATTAGTLSGTPSDTNMIVGPFARTIASGNANSNYILYPVGKTTYNPIWLAPTTSDVSILKAEVFDTNSGTTDGSILNLATTRRWEAPLISGTISNVNVRLGDANLVTSNIPVQAPSAAGVYTSAFGSTATFVAGTPNTVQSSIASTSYTGFISYAESNLCSGSPNPGNTTATNSTLCLGESTTLGIETIPTGSGVTYQWKVSINGGVDYSDISLATDPTYVATPSAVSYYKCAVTCTSSSQTTESNPIQIMFTNSVASTTPGTRCGTGTVGLGATTSSGTLNWYAAATGGTSLGTGTTFNTPSISATTDFYVAAQTANTGNSVIGTNTTLTNSSLDVTVFNNYNQSYKMQTLYTAAELSASGLYAGDITAIKYKVSTMGDAATNANFTVKIGTTSVSALTSTFQNNTSYTTVFPAATFTHVVGENTITFSTPFTWDGTSNIIIEISQSGADLYANSQTYYTATTANTVAYSINGSPTATVSTKRPNITFYGQVGCSSPRVAVTATVTPPPALTLNATSGTICEGESTPLITITSGASDYDTYSWIPTTGVSGDAASGWVFNPTVTTSYVLNASNSVSGCNTTVNGLITVDPLPSALVITPSPLEVCVDAIATLNVTGGLSNLVLIDEGFNAPTNNWVATNNSTGGTPADAAWTLRPNGYVYTNSTLLPTFYSNDNSQFYMSNSDDQGSGTTATLLTSPSFDLTGLTSANLSFWHFYRDYDSSDSAKVEVSIDNGGTWTTLVTYTTTQGALAAFANANLNLTPYIGQSNVKVRFNYNASYAYYWNIDNVKITGIKSNPITWQPVTNLYTDATATTAYVDGADASTVYFKSNVVGGPVTYTVTSTPSTLCERINTVNVTVLPNTTFAWTSGDDTQTVCVETAITDIVYTVTNGTGASASGLPTGVIGTYSSGTYTLSGTPTAVGTFDYAVWGTGTCEPSMALTGTIVVDPNTTLALTSGETNQTVNNGSSITDIVYTVTNGTSANVTGLPTGVSGTYNAGVFTISGLPTQVGTFNYSVTGTGTCASSAAMTGTITVNSCDIGWANLQWPGSGTINTCGTYDVYAQVWMSGVTEAAGAGDGITAWMGISTTDTDPSTWTEANWYPATFNVQSGNNDEFMHTFSNLTAGNYFIASRFKYTCGSYYYGAYNAGGGGAWDGTNNINATLTVNAIAPPTGDATQTFCNAGTIADLIAVGDNLKWYDAATLGNELTLSTALVNGTHYFASQTVSSCESTARLDVTAVVNITAAPMSVAAKWTYEPVQGTNINPTPNIGTGTSALVGVMTGAGTATGMNTATGCGTQTSGTTAWAIGTANPGTVNESSGAQWNVSTVGLSNVKLAWEQRFSNTATNTLRLQYTTDGSTWNNFEMTESNTTYCLGTLNNGRFETDITGDSYRRINVDLSAITGANNNPNFGWRVVAAHYQSTGEFRRVTVPTTIATGGTWRFDNVTLSGSSTQTFCEGATVANLVATGTALKWYADASGGTELVSTEVLTTGTYYASQTLNACESQTRLAVQVVINPNTTIALTSGDVNQTVLNGIDITDIVYTITNGTGATVTGLPNGVIATYLAGTLTISGTPIENGTFNYSIYGTGTCASSSVLTGTITVNDCVIGWANLQWPGNGTINTCNPYGVYAQIWIDGVTNAPGAGANITAWIGLSTENTDPSTWTETIWYPASFNVQVGNNDEFWYDFSNLPAGTYYIASRFKYACSPYYYGGFQGGAWNGTSNVNAQLTVNAITMPTGNTTQYMCSTSPFTTLNDLNVVAGGTLIWYDAASGGNVLPGTTSMIAGTTYYAANQQDGCESARLAVLVQEDCSLAIDPETEMIRMYPNPTADFLNLVSETGIKDVEVFNQLGQKVQVSLLTPEKLDVTQLAIGTYVIRLTLMNGNISSQIFIKK